MPDAKADYAYFIDVLSHLHWLQMTSPEESIIPIRARDAAVHIAGILECMALAGSTI